MFDRVSSDTLNYGNHAEGPVSASRYTVAVPRSARSRQFGGFSLYRHLREFRPGPKAI
jgi:hypothetical protein